MPKYVIFLIIANRPEAHRTKDDNETTEDPHLQKMLDEFLSWIKAELEAKRIEGGEYLPASSEETNIRIDFHGRDTASEAKVGKDDEETVLPPPSSTVTHGHQADTSTNITAYYTANFSTVSDVVAWGRSCPISFDGFALEIRQLQDLNTSLQEAPSKVREWTGDHIVSLRKQLLEKGDMKREEDGTQWVKVKDEEGVKELVAEAEEREADREQIEG